MIQALSSRKYDEKSKLIAIQRQMLDESTYQNSILEYHETGSGPEVKQTLT